MSKTRPKKKRSRPSGKQTPRTRGSAQRPRPSGAPVRGWKAIAIFAALALVLAAPGIALIFGGTDGEVETDEYDPPQISGSPLPELDAGNVDPAQGMPAPEIRGTDFERRGVSITDDGTPKLVLIVAHWCLPCREDVRDLSIALHEGSPPEGADIYLLATANDPGRQGYPVSSWLQREAWTAPVLMDDDVAAAEAFGATALPLWVFIDEDGRVAERVSGRLPSDEALERLEQLTDPALEPEPAPEEGSGDPDGGPGPEGEPGTE